jgi:hypothetical protein
MKAIGSPEIAGIETAFRGNVSASHPQNADFSTAIPNKPGYIAEKNMLNLLRCQPLY